MARNQTAVFRKTAVHTRHSCGPTSHEWGIVKPQQVSGEVLHERNPAHYKLYLLKVNKTFEDLQILQELNKAWIDVGPQIKNYMENSVEIQLLQVRPSSCTSIWTQKSLLFMARLCDRICWSDQRWQFWSTWVWRTRPGQPHGSHVSCPHPHQMPQGTLERRLLGWTSIMTSATPSQLSHKSLRFVLFVILDFASYLSPTENKNRAHRFEVTGLHVSILDHHFFALFVLFLN